MGVSIGGYDPVGAIGGSVIGSLVGGQLIGGGVGSIAGGVTGAFMGGKPAPYRPNIGLPPTEADAQKNEADKSNLRRQRAAALLSQGARANILTSPLGISGGSTEPSFSQGRKTLLGS